MRWRGALSLWLASYLLSYEVPANAPWLHLRIKECPGLGRPLYNSAARRSIECYKPSTPNKLTLVSPIDSLYYKRITLDSE
jgi:hypothetical protein